MNVDMENELKSQFATKIAVVIPTIGRDSLNTSLQSILSQTYKVYEVILCYDGDDFNSFHQEIFKYSQVFNSNDIKFKTINVGPFSGGNVARQRGIEIAISEFIALLDDDDEWLPDHIKNHVEYIERNHDSLMLLSCRASVINVETNDVQFELPPRLISKIESIPEYLFKVNKIVADCGFIQSSLMLFSRELATMIPFRQDLKYHQDIDWLLRLSQSKIDFKFYQSVSNTVNYYSTPLSVSKKITARQSAEWALETFENKRCLGDFLLTQSYNYARNNGNIFDEFWVFGIALAKSKPGIKSLIRYCIKLFRIDKILK